MPETSLGGRVQERHGQVERADHERGLTEVARGVGVAAALRGDGAQAGQYRECVAERVVRQDFPVCGRAFRGTGMVRGSRLLED